MRKRYSPNSLMCKADRYVWCLLVLCVAAFLLPAPSIGQSIWSVDFEENWTDRWYADAGTWEAGTPTSGPESAFAGISVAATNLDGNYNEPIDSRLIRITSFVVPPASENPQLRFWHWFSFSESDTGEVQLSTDGGATWETISPMYYGTSSGVWSRPSLDMSAYAGQSVLLAFDFHSVPTPDFGTDDPDVSTGWYIDEVEVVTGPLFFNSPETFETGLGDWHAERGTWEVGVATSGPGACYDGSSQCAATVLAGNYNEPIDSRLISSPFVVPPASENPQLRFWHWFSFSESDTGEVQLSTDGGATWETVLGPYVENSGGIWSRPFLNLSLYAGQSVLLAFDFHSVPTPDFGTDDPDVSTGWYIDEVLVVGLPDPEDPAISVTPNAIDFGVVSVNGGATIEATVTNTGNADLEVSTVSITGANPEQFTTDDSAFILEPGSNQVIPVSFIPQVEGSFTAGLTIESNVGTTTIILSGETPRLAISVDPVNVDFGEEVLVGESLGREVTVTNTGNVDLEVSSVSLGGTNPDQFTADLSTFILEAGSSQVIPVEFIPLDKGVFTATLTIASNAGDIDITLSGTAPSGVATEEGELPTVFALQGAYPNPFNPATTIRFDLPEPATVTLLVIDVLGQVVRRQKAGHLQAGRARELRVEADGLASGVYFYRVLARTAQGVDAGTGSFILMK